MVRPSRPGTMRAHASGGPPPPLPAAAVPPSADHLALAHAVADAAAAVTTRYFRSALPVDAKADASPVTIADREAEAAARALLGREAPGHAVYGEEGGMTPPRVVPGGGEGGGGGPPGGEYLWVIDPIDGTKSFITGERERWRERWRERRRKRGGREEGEAVDHPTLTFFSFFLLLPPPSGKPLWGTLIALLHRGTPILGIIDQPVTRERWVGCAGAPTTLNGAPIAARPCPGGLAEAYVYATTPLMFGPPGSPTAAAWDRVSGAAKVPLYGCDCYAYGLVAGGWADAVVEADLGPYDFLALAPIVAGAGGTMTDWRGRPLGAAWDPVTGHSVAGCPREVVAAGDAAVHAEVLALLQA